MADYPSDADGNALRNVAEVSDMSRPMVIDFAVGVLDEATSVEVARRCAARCGAAAAVDDDILVHMKQLLIEIDDACARDLERVAPARQRKRASFVRLAIRRAIDLALDRETEAAYRSLPIRGGVLASDLAGWDDQNQLAELRTRALRSGPGRARGAKSGK